MDDSVAQDDRTVFVRNVAFTVSEEDLSALFSDVGPVRKAFLVRPRGSDNHKGYGFVSFSLKEDAAKAAAAMRGKKLEGRALKVEVAHKRDSLQARNEKRKARGSDAVEAGNHRKVKQRLNDRGENLAVDEDEDEEPSDGDAVRSLAPAAALRRHSSAPTAVDKAQLCKAVAVGCIPKGRLPEVLRIARAAGPVTRIDDVIPEHIAGFAKLAEDGCQGHSLLVHYESGKCAFLAVWALHRKVFAASKRGKEGGVLWARQVNGEGAQVKKWRIILRNIPFGVSEEELAALLGKVGFVWSLSIPQLPNGRMRGFAFAAFTCRAHAERAIASVNGKEFKGRLLVADWSIAKAAYQSLHHDAADRAAPPHHEGETYDLAAPSAQPSVPHEAARADDALSDDDEGDSAGSDEPSGKSTESDSDGATGSPADDQDTVSSDEGEEPDAEGSVQQGRAAGSSAAGDGLGDAERGMMSRVLDGLLHEGRGATVAPAAKGENAASLRLKVKDSSAATQQAGTSSGRTPADLPGEGDGKARRATGAAATAVAAGDKGKEAKAEWEGARSDPQAERKGGGGEIRRQVFVRNLPLDVTIVELSARLSRYGTVKACRGESATSQPAREGTMYSIIGCAFQMTNSFRNCPEHRGDMVQSMLTPWLWY